MTGVGWTKRRPRNTYWIVRSNWQHYTLYVFCNGPWLVCCWLWSSGAVLAVIWWWFWFVPWPRISWWAELFIHLDFYIINDGIFFYMITESCLAEQNLACSIFHKYFLMWISSLDNKTVFLFALLKPVFALDMIPSNPKSPEPKLLPPMFFIFASLWHQQVQSDGWFFWCSYFFVLICLSSQGGFPCWYVTTPMILVPQVVQHTVLLHLCDWWDSLKMIFSQKELLS